MFLVQIGTYLKTKTKPKKFMYSMKNNWSLFLVFFALVSGISSCDNNQQITCSSYDTDKFIGNYYVSESCQQNYHGVTYATITPSNSINQNEITFLNFNNTGINVTAYIQCSQIVNNYTEIYFQIPQQNVGSTAYTVAGEGNYTEAYGSPRLYFSVQLNEYGQANYCTYTYTK